MVRQDKIGVIITHFRVDGIHPDPRQLDPIHSLIGAVLSQATRDEISSRAYVRLLERYPRLKSLASAPESEIAETIRIAGLSKQKAKAIKGIINWALETFGHPSLDGLSQWSDETIISRLTQISGVGVKSVAIMLCFAMNRDVFPVDVHVNRILTRVGVVPRKWSAEKTFRMINPVIPYGRDYFLHMNLIVFGRSVCMKQSPKCEGCPFSDICDRFNGKNDWLA